MKQKVVQKLVIAMLLIGVTLTFIESYNFRSYGINTAIDKAESIAEAVKNGLTAHMVNNNMHQVDVFLNSISNMENVDELWIIRGQKVINQYGPPDSNEMAKDQLDQIVLNTSRRNHVLEESISSTKIRVTIPYNAKRDSTIDCVSCHNVKYGETLGAISIILDISDIKESGLRLAFSIFFFTVVAIFLIVYLANSMLKPHLETIDELSGKVKNISNGIFTNIIQKKRVSEESENLIKEYNLLVNGLSTTFSDIDKKLNIFVGNQSFSSNNPLLNAQRIIGNLAEIYQFKKEIEIDDEKIEIYKRLAQILINKFNLNQFNFMEQDYLTNKTSVVYSHGDSDFCSSQIENKPELCRVSRSTNDVCSVKDHKVCQQFKNNKKLYYCIDINIGDNSKLIVNFVLDNNNELEKLKEHVSLIKNYFREAAPSLIVKLLLQELKASAFRDGLTSLYNRKFLDEHITKLVPQALRENINIGVLMLDMDHFKAVNDEYGHDIGDLVLKELSRILMENVRDSDIVVRYGGEEFVVLLVGVTDEYKALDVANKIRQKVSENEMNIYAGNKLSKTISVGLSMFPSDSSNFDLVMKNADIALYDAKRTGRNQAVRFQEKVDIELF